MQEIFQKVAERFYWQLKAQPPYPIPPLELIVNSGSIDIPHYFDNMLLYTKDIISQCLLERGHKVWEIGCGAGRIAKGLINYLSSEGGYIGVDVDQASIDWCKRHLTPKNKNFQFYKISLSNNYYYEEDNHKINHYDFRFLGTQQFDCAIVLSLFNHLHLEDTQQYLQEIGSRLTLNGLAYLTFLVIDKDFKEFQAKTKQHPNLQRDKRGIWYGYKKQNFFAGYEPELLKKTFTEANLRVINYSPGAWANKPRARLYQDWYLVERIN